MTSIVVAVVVLLVAAWMIRWWKSRNHLEIDDVGGDFLKFLMETTVSKQAANASLEDILEAYIQKTGVCYRASYDEPKVIYRARTRYEILRAAGLLDPGMWKDDCVSVYAQSLAAVVAMGQTLSPETKKHMNQRADDSASY